MWQSVNAKVCNFFKCFLLCQLNMQRQLSKLLKFISSCFTHPQGILGVYDFLLSDESNRSNIQNCPGSSKLSGVSVTQSKTCKIKCANPLKNVTHTAPGCENRPPVANRCVFVIKNDPYLKRYKQFCSTSAICHTRVHERLPFRRTTYDAGVSLAKTNVCL